MHVVKFYVYISPVSHAGSRIVFWDSFVNLLNARTPTFYLNCQCKYLVHPIVEYGNVIWGSHYILDPQKLERLQCKATRIIPSLYDLPYNDRLRNLQCLPSLQYRQCRSDLIFLCTYIRYSMILIRIGCFLIFIHKRSQQENLQTPFKVCIYIYL